LVGLLSGRPRQRGWEDGAKTHSCQPWFAEGSSQPKAAKQKLAVILNPINDVKHQPKKVMTFRGFIEKYRKLKFANQKGTTAHGYETNIRALYLPEFDDTQLSEISIDVVQAFHTRGLAVTTR
jgi:hypothetical protein